MDAVQQANSGHPGTPMAMAPVIYCLWQELDDIKRFRQLDSKCPGHPEYRWTSGIETTTEPLGQGVATSVGMALAAKWMAQYFNRPASR